MDRPPAASPPRPPGLPMTEALGAPHPDAAGITEDVIRDVVAEFYRRAREDDRLGPIFSAHVRDWSEHLSRMNDFWSAALLRSGRYSGRPVDGHRPIRSLEASHFTRWVDLFEATVRDLCPPAQAEAFLVRAHKMRDALTRALGLAG